MTVHSRFVGGYFRHGERATSSWFTWTIASARLARVSRGLEAPETGVGRSCFVSRLQQDTGGRKNGQSTSPMCYERRRGGLLLLLLVLFCFFLSCYFSAAAGTAELQPGKGARTEGKRGARRMSCRAHRGVVPRPLDGRSFLRAVVSVPLSHGRAFSLLVR